MNIGAKISQGLQKQKKSYIFRTVICRISGSGRAILEVNCLVNKWLERAKGYSSRWQKRGEKRNFLHKTHINTNNNF